MKIIKRIFLPLFILVLYMQSAVGQVALNPVFPEDGLFFPDQLYSLSISNFGVDVIEGYIEVTVQQNGTQLVLKMNSFPLSLEPGIPLFGQGVSWDTNVAYGQNEAGTALRSSGVLPMGRYVFCYNFYSLSRELLEVSCQEIRIKGFAPPELLSPRNEEVVTTVPLLSWLPPSFSSPVHGVSYYLKLVELEEDQNAQVGLRTNFPLLELNNYIGNQVLFSSDFGDLKIGNTYAWQVSATKNGADLGRTEVWEFTFGTESFAKHKKKTTESYTMVNKREVNSSFIEINKLLHFGYSNNFDEQFLDYSISSLNERDKIVSDLPQIKLDSGINLLTLSVKKIGLLKGSYMLLVKNRKGEKFYLEFLISSKKDNKK